MVVDVDEAEVARVHARLVDRDEPYSLKVVGQALPLWLGEQCEQLARDSTNRSDFIEWLEHFAVREFANCTCRWSVGDSPICPVHSEVKA